MNKEISQNNHSEEQKQNAGFCGGCRSNCPLTNPNCSTGMERAGWSSEEIERGVRFGEEYNYCLGCGNRFTDHGNDMEV